MRAVRAMLFVLLIVARAPGIGKADDSVAIPPLTIADVQWFGAADFAWTAINDPFSDAINLMTVDAPTSQQWTAMADDFTSTISAADAWTGNHPKTEGGLVDVAASFDQWVTVTHDAATQCKGEARARAFDLCTGATGKTLIAEVPYVLVAAAIRDGLANGTATILGQSQTPAVVASPIAMPTSPSAEGHTLTGSITVFGDHDSVAGSIDGGECYGVGGYNDMYVGQSVVVKDGSGTILALGELTSSELSNVGSSRWCEFQILVEGIPDSPFYIINVSHRGDLTYSAQQLDDANWQLDLSLGNP